MRTEAERLTELEMRVAHLERLADGLSLELLIANQAHDKLAGQLDRLQLRLQAAMDGPGPDGPPEEEPPPPHY